MVNNGTLIGGQGTDTAIFTAGQDGETLLTAVIQAPGEDDRILEIRIPVIALTYNRWLKQAESRYDLYPNGQVDIMDLLLIMENCHGGLQ